MRSLAIALTLLLAASAQAQGRFEGTVNYRMTTPGGRTMDVTMSQRGTKLRQDAQPAPGQTMASIVDSETGEMTMLMPDQKAYMTMNMKGMPGGAPGQPPPVADASQVKVTPTGKKETIAGIACEGYAIENKDGSKVDICAARGMGFLGSLGGTVGMSPAGDVKGLAGNPGLARLAKDGFFPLRIVARNPQGQTMTMEATKVDRKAPDASLFKPPAGYRKVDAPSGPMGPPPGAGAPPPGGPPGTAPGGPPRPAPRAK